MPYVFLFASIFSNVVGQLLMKYTADSISLSGESKLMVIKGVILNYYFMGGLFFYFVGMIAWLVTLTKLELSTAYPYLALTYVFVVASSYFLFKESLDIYKIVGIVLILGGILVLSIGLSSNS